ncbi:probable Ufm1-specific protease 1 [Paramuricea clavata]|uniref:Probable Ufm1-specific protease 1 n=1 Tax=Paramuricea clavata TaxID=317549 RepID=A0A7D9HNA2_PARCT|nr:probable Ufm1-specific protease 1 [Paramuricea clavata]
MYLSSVHIGLPLPCFQCYLVSGTYQYYHYACDGHNDVGWGCAYRTLQTLCSWINNNCNIETQSPNVPSLSKIQETLVTIGDKPSTFMKSREWIGSFEICLFLDHCYNISSKIIHVRSGSEVGLKFDEFVEHFQKFGSPVMIGGDSDAASKALLGIATDGNKKYFLILDPHFSGNPDIDSLQRNGWVAWKDEELFLTESFYNFCLPQCGQSDAG